ncbi:MAG TPA: hypothetical protein VGN12_05555 [Pirellulales bacterium]|jgi:hypothetical protein
MPTIDFPPRFQFSLRGMLIAVAVLTVLLGLLAVAGGLLAWLLAIFVVWILPTPLLIAAIYSRGDMRAFSIGALVPWVSRWANPPIYDSLMSVVNSTLWVLVMAGICGAVAVASRRWMERDASR